MQRLALTIILAVSCTLAHTQDLTATLNEERVAVPDEPNRTGLQMVKRALTFGPAAIRYQQLVDPKQGDAPVVQRYGDYTLGLDFPRYTWNWDLEYFLTVTVTRPGQEPVNTTRAVLQKGVYILQQGPRVMADMVWPLPAVAGRPAAEMAVRLIALADDPQWLYLRAGVEGDPEAKISEVRLHSYPTTTSGPPERQRWVTTLTRSVPMGGPVAPLQSAEEWGMVMHNRMAQEEEGTLLVTDQREIKSAGAVGVYPIEVQLQTVGVSEVHVALGYFRETPWQKAVDSFRRAAPDRLRRLQTLDWTAPVDLAGWQKDQREVEELLKLAPGSQTAFGPEWTSVLARADDALKTLAAQPGDAAAARSLVLLSRQAEDLKSRLYEPAINALIDQATR